MTSFDILSARSNNQFRKYKSDFHKFFWPLRIIFAILAIDLIISMSKNSLICEWRETQILVTYKRSSVIMESWWWLLDCDSPKHWSWHYTVVILKINNPQFGKIFFSKSFDVYYLMDLSRLITERAHNRTEINILSWTIFFSTIEKHQVKAT